MIAEFILPSNKANLNHSSVSAFVNLSDTEESDVTSNARIRNSVTLNKR
ncbi:MAG: hypothetical protein HYZ42_18425 [Bacteroidetes bacterium]|nr:hypothetical protein [Bacteroidota bacterium]